MLVYKTTQISALESRADRVAFRIGLYEQFLKDSIEQGLKSCEDIDRDMIRMLAEEYLPAN